jgi:7,8-dihydro-6-hydroxymethylpterin-pyrophosphokinase
MSGMFTGSPRDLLGKCHAIEHALGRTRKQHHGSRTADIDILAFGDMVVQEQDLTLPHPAFLKRRFCFMGAAEIVPDFILPGSTITLKAYCASASKLNMSQEIRFPQCSCFNTTSKES